VKKQPKLSRIWQERPSILKSKWGDRPKGIKIFFYIYMLGFLAGTVSHVLDIWHGGFMPYTSSPLPFNVYWSSLTFFDPLAIILLFYFPYAGMVMAVLIMVSDIAVNLYVTWVERFTVHGSRLKYPKCC